jgi:hypothetical protein
VPKKSWSKVQAANNKKFQAKLDKITNYLIEGDWHGNFAVVTGSDGDAITNFAVTKKELPAETISFSRLENGAIKAEVESGGEVSSSIVGIQPYERTFYLISLDGEDSDICFGRVSMRSGVIDLTVLDQLPSGGEAAISVAQYTNLAGI